MESVANRRWDTIGALEHTFDQYKVRYSTARDSKEESPSTYNKKRREK